MLLSEIYQIISKKNILCGNIHCKYNKIKWDQAYFKYKINYNECNVCGICKDEFDDFDYNLDGVYYGHFCQVYRPNWVCDIDIAGGAYDHGFMVAAVHDDGTYFCEDIKRNRELDNVTRDEIELYCEDKTFLLKCGHRFHSHCIDGYEYTLLTHQVNPLIFKCPLCRQEYSEKLIEKYKNDDEYCGKVRYDVYFKYHYHQHLS